MSPRFVDRLSWWLGEGSFSSKQQVYAIAYFSYIWDALRNGYIESGRREYEDYNSRSMVRHRLESYRDLKAYEGEIALDIDQMERPWSRYEKKNELDSLMTKEFGCPLPEVPKYVRMYQIFSTAFAIYSFIKYGIVSSIYYGWFGIDQKYTCYIPGRLGISFDISHEIPWLGFVVYSFHIVYRSVWYIMITGIEVDCFLFLCYDKETVLSKQYELMELNGSQISPEAAYRKYLCNRIFYERHMDSLGRTWYTLKPNRTIGQFTRLADLANKFRMSCYFLIFGVFVPFLINGFITQASHHSFDRSYPACRSFSGRPVDANFQWTFDDNFRFYYFFFDIMDNALFFLDNAGAFAIPFTGAMVAAHDLNLRFDALNERVTSFIDRLRFILFDNYYFLDADCKWSSDLSVAPVPITKRTIEDLEKESNSIFNDTVNAFAELEKVDVYIRGFALITVYIWFMTNMSFQAFTLFRLNSIADTTKLIYRYTQANMNVCLLGAFALLARTNTKTQITYNKLCSVMALYPTIYQTKISWCWLLEYFHRSSSRNTLHLIGKDYALSNLNILRCVSWFVTCTVIILNLMNRH